MSRVNLYDCIYIPETIQCSKLHGCCNIMQHKMVTVYDKIQTVEHLMCCMVVATQKVLGMHKVHEAMESRYMYIYYSYNIRESLHVYSYSPHQLLDLYA